MYSADFCISFLVKIRKKGLKILKRRRLSLIFLYNVRGNVFFCFTRDNVSMMTGWNASVISCVELILFKDKRIKSREGKKPVDERESIWVGLFCGTHTKKKKSQEMVFWKKTWAFNAAGGSSPRFHRRRPPREDEKEEVAVFLSLFFFTCCCCCCCCCIILPSSSFCTVYERGV